MLTIASVLFSIDSQYIRKDDSGVARWPGCRAALSGGAGGGRRGGGKLAVGSGQANVTRRRRFGAAGEVLVERQEGWRDTDNLAAFGG